MSNNFRIGGEPSNKLWGPGTDRPEDVWCEFWPHGALGKMRGVEVARRLNLYEEMLGALKGVLKYDDEADVLSTSRANNIRAIVAKAEGRT